MALPTDLQLFSDPGQNVTTGHKYPTDHQSALSKLEDFFGFGTFWVCFRSLEGVMEEFSWDFAFIQIYTYLIQPQQLFPKRKC